MKARRLTRSAKWEERNGIKTQTRHPKTDLETLDCSFFAPCALGPDGEMLWEWGATSCFAGWLARVFVFTL